MVPDSLTKLESGNPLIESELTEIFVAMFNGKMSDEDIKRFLLGLKDQGERGLDLAVGAGIMRQRSTRVQLHSSVRPLIDNCGTGGDGSNSFNISTASAIVAASAGIKVAKHGNRSVSSKCGSADLLFEAGLPDTLTPDDTAKLLEETGFTFFFAPHFHPVMKYVMPVRNALGVRTIFNLMGPLANPIAPDYQVIGVGDKKYLQPMAEGLLGLGVTRGLVVHSEDGMDELSPAAPTHGKYIHEGKITDLRVDPKEFGYQSTLDDLAGGDAVVNHKILQEMLAGKSKVIEAVALNAGAVLWIGGTAKDLKSGVELANDHIMSGRTNSYFNTWLTAAQNLAAGHKNV